MQSSSVFYRVNSPSVVAETLGRETIIIHFDSGMYYSTNETGALIWSMIERGTPADRIAACLAARCDANGISIPDSVARFLNDLEAEGLVVKAEGTSEADEIAPGERIAFTEPSISRYTDMADLLLLDPVHEIEDRSGRNADSPH